MKVYIDMDNVLCDFALQASVVYRYEVVPNVLVAEDVLEKMNKDMDFWRYMPPTDFARNILSTLHTHKAQFIICSRADNLLVMNAKMRWLDTFLKNQLTTEYLIGVNFVCGKMAKGEYLNAMETDLLVDDMRHELAAFPGHRYQISEDFLEEHFYNFINAFKNGNAIKDDWQRGLMFCEKSKKLSEEKGDMVVCDDCAETIERKKCKILMIKCDDCEEISRGDLYTLPIKLISSEKTISRPMLCYSCYLKRKAEYIVMKQAKGKCPTCAFSCDCRGNKLENVDEVELRKRLEQSFEEMKKGGVK